MPSTKTRTRDMPDELAEVPILRDIHDKAKEVDEAKADLAKLVHQCNVLVMEAVDDGEPYRDIATSAGRSLGWVQTALEALGVEGPRVRRRPARAKIERPVNEVCPSCGRSFKMLSKHKCKK